MPLPSSVTVHAPATIANVGCGFDVLGLCLTEPYDTVRLTRTDRPGLRIRHLDDYDLPTDPNRNVWVAPGGMIEIDETPAQAARREMQEETGCEVELLGILGVYGGPAFRVQYQNGDEVAYVMTVYEARITAGELEPDGQETLEIGFFSHAETHRLPTGAWLPEVLQDVFASRATRSSRSRGANG